MGGRRGGEQGHTHKYKYTLSSLPSVLYTRTHIDLQLLLFFTFSLAFPLSLCLVSPHTHTTHKISLPLSLSFPADVGTNVHVYSGLVPTDIASKPCREIMFFIGKNRKEPQRRSIYDPV